MLRMRMDEVGRGHGLERGSVHARRRVLLLLMLLRLETRRRTSGSRVARRRSVVRWHRSVAHARRRSEMKRGMTIRRVTAGGVLVMRAPVARSRVALLLLVLLVLVLRRRRRERRMREGGVRASSMRGRRGRRIIRIARRRRRVGVERHLSVLGRAVGCWWLPALRRLVTRRRRIVGRESGIVDLLLRVIVAGRRRRIGVCSRRGWRRRVRSASSLRRLRDGRVVDVDRFGTSALGCRLLLLLPCLGGILPSNVLPFGLESRAVRERDEVSERERAPS